MSSQAETPDRQAGSIAGAGAASGDCVATVAGAAGGRGAAGRAGGGRGFGATTGGDAGAGCSIGSGSVGTSSGGGGSGGGGSCAGGIGSGGAGMSGTGGTVGAWKTKSTALSSGTSGGTLVPIQASPANTARCSNTEPVPAIARSLSRTEGHRDVGHLRMLRPIIRGHYRRPAAIMTDDALHPHTPVLGCGLTPAGPAGSALSG